MAAAAVAAPPPPPHAALSRKSLSPGVAFCLRRAEDLDNQLTNTGDKWVVVEFGAKWAAACDAMQVCFDELARDNPEAHFLRVDVDLMPSAAARFGILRIPSYAFFWCGEKETEFAGCSERKLRETLSNCLELGPEAAWRSLGTSKREALERSRQEAERRAQEVAMQRARELAQKRAQEDEAARTNEAERRLIRQKTERQYGELAKKFAPPPAAIHEHAEEGSEEGSDGGRHQAKHEEERLEREREEAAAAEAARAREELQRRQREEEEKEAAARHAEAEAKRHAEAEEAARKEREHQEALARHEAEQKAKEEAEKEKARLKREAEERARQEAALAEQAARQAAAEKKRQDILKKIKDIETRGRLKYDAQAGRIVVTAELKFKQRYFGQERRDEPTAEFSDRVSAQQLMTDAAQALSACGMKCEVVRVRKAQDAAARPDAAKDKWLQELAQNQANLVQKQLVSLGLKQDLLTTRVVSAASEATYFSLPAPI